MDWRDLLRSLIENPAERERIATEINVHPVTLSRWVSGETSPRPHSVRQLVRAVPKQYRAQLRSLLESTFPISSDVESEGTLEVSTRFIAEVLENRATTPDMLRFWSVTRMILQEALKHLDTERLGIEITVVLCMPPRSGKIRSLRETVGLGSGPWGSGLEEKALLLGAESLAGYVTASCRLEQVGDLRQNRTFVPAYRSEHEVSAAACPLMYGCRVAGCLLLSSTQPYYFSAEARLSLIRMYAHLVSLALEPDDFFEPVLIDLHIMPPIEEQQKHFANFRQRVLKLMQESSNTEHRLASAEAEKQVWQQFEERLLTLTNEAPST